MNTELPIQLPSVLLPWYASCKRDLPWRKDRDCYHVWLSEIMLQQTRVEAVKGYYQRFLRALPTIGDLAACDDDRLRKLWEGLGYYSRVRNLKKAAQVVMQTYGGVFPGEYEAILALPGIGEYTAGAICSICFDRPTPAVDGNVLRVVSRLTADETPIDLPAYKARVRDMLAAIYPKEAGFFTQALMELGATVCGPNRPPVCSDCPCRVLCAGARAGIAEKLPVRLPKKAKKEEERTVLILSCGDLYALEKRPEKGLLAGLWQFPNVSGKLEASAAAAAAGVPITRIYRQVERQHIFTHIVWKMRGFYMEAAQPEGGYVWRSRREIEDGTALPTAFRQFWEETDHV